MNPYCRSKTKRMFENAVALFLGGCQEGVMVRDSSESAKGIDPLLMLAGAPLESRVSRVS